VWPLNSERNNGAKETPEPVRTASCVRNGETPLEGIARGGRTATAIENLLAVSQRRIRFVRDDSKEESKIIAPRA